VEVFQGSTKWLWVTMANKDPSYWADFLMELEYRRADLTAPAA